MSPGPAIPTLRDAPARGASRLLADAFGRCIARGQYRPGDRLPTRRDIAARTGLGYGTVSRTMELLARRGLIEQKPGEGAFIAAPADHAVGTRRMGVVLPFWSAPSAWPIVHDHLAGVNEAASVIGHRVEMVPNVGDEAARHEFVRRILALRLDGLIWIAPALEHEVNIARLIDRGLKVIVTIRRFHRTPVPVVREDVAKLARLVAGAMRQRRRKRLMVICRHPGTDAHSSDILDALRAARVGVEPCPAMGTPDAERRITEQLTRSPGVDAVLSLQLSLLGPLAGRRGLDVFQLWGSAAVAQMTWPNLPMTVIETPMVAMGRQAVKELNKQWGLPAGDVEDLSPRLVSLPGR